MTCQDVSNITSLLFLGFNIFQNRLDFKSSYCAMPIFTTEQTENAILATSLLLAIFGNDFRTFDNLLIAYHSLTSSLLNAHSPWLGRYARYLCNFVVLCTNGLDALAECLYLRFTIPKRFECVYLVFAFADFGFTGSH